MAWAFSSMPAMMHASPMGIGWAISKRKRFVERNRILIAQILPWALPSRRPPGYQNRVLLAQEIGGPFASTRALFFDGNLHNMLGDVEEESASSMTPSMTMMVRVRRAFSGLLEATLIGPQLRGVCDRRKSITVATVCPTTSGSRHLSTRTASGASSATSLETDSG